MLHNVNSTYAIIKNINLDYILFNTSNTNGDSVRKGKQTFIKNRILLLESFDYLLAGAAHVDRL